MVGLYVCYGGECFLFHGNDWWNFYVTDMCFAIHFLYIHIWLEIYLLTYKYHTFISMSQIAFQFDQVALFSLFP